MLILTMRTDKPDAEIALFNDEALIEQHSWLAHRALAETLHLHIKELLERHSYELQNIDGIVVYQGPGSFTGLRIGITVANTIASSLEIPIIAASNDNWGENGVARLLHGENEHIALPEYGAPVHITPQKK